MQPLVRLALLLVVAGGCGGSALAQSPIHLNQTGFYPDAPKEAVVVTSGADSFYVRASGGEVVYRGRLEAAQTWSPSGETVRRAAFSALRDEGAYVLDVPGVGTSYPFEVAGHVHQEVARAALKGFYFQRASTPLDAAYAGRWARPAGHPDTQVLVHASAASAERPAGTVISAPKGWYDAGDYNKYIVNSGISTATLLQLYEHFPAYFAALETGIPESGGALPDVLDEVLWNLRWMLTMQDPADGGVYHKLTTASFSGYVMPNRATAPRYVVQKSTAAALDFAAVAAQASRVFAAFETATPGLSDSLRAAALDAWAWARAHPGVVYRQSAMNATYDPDIVTGEYGDGDVSDEFDWAAMELYVTTHADSFLVATRPFSPIQMALPWWGGVRTLGYYSVLDHRAETSADVDTQALEAALLRWVDGLVARQRASAYGVVMGSGDFYWGSNAVAANQGVALVQAYRLSGDEKYLHAALANLDYLLGRNATGYAFVTGYGSKTPLHPHHRPSEADAVVPPVPGLLVGGPNPGREDGCSYPSALPARAYTDEVCSYASNEIAINWNAPLAYLAGATEALLSASGLPVTLGHAGDAARPPATGVNVYPNPFADTTTIRLSLREPSPVRVTLHDLLGRTLRVVAGGEVRASGASDVLLDAADLPGGVYVLRVATGAEVQTRLVVRAGE